MLYAVKQASLIRSKSGSSFSIYVTKRQAAQDTAFEKSSSCTFCVLCFRREVTVHKQANIFKQLSSVQLECMFWAPDLQHSELP